MAIPAEARTHPSRAQTAAFERRARRALERIERMVGAGSLRSVSLLTAAVLGVGFALVFFYAPNDANQGFLYKIFYLHVPLAILALSGFVVGGLMAIAHLYTRDDRWDVRSYVTIHTSLIFGLAVLITGSIWARGSWGHWWVWNEPTLVSFLIIFLLYACYQPLRFAIEDPERQARYASVFAITAGAFVPLNFLAVRLSHQYIHPRVLESTSSLTGQMWLTFLLCFAGMTLLFITLCRYELTAKHTAAQLRALRRRLSDDPDEALAPAPRSAAPRIVPTPRPAPRA
jgi:heme exporter protein C